MSNNEIEAMLSALLYPYPQTLLLFPCTEPRAPTLPNFTHIPISHITQFIISNAKDIHIHTHQHTYQNQIPMQRQPGWLLGRLFLSQVCKLTCLKDFNIIAIVPISCRACIHPPWHGYRSRIRYHI